MKTIKQASSHTHTHTQFYDIKQRQITSRPIHGHNKNIAMSSINDCQLHFRIRLFFCFVCVFSCSIGGNGTLFPSNVCSSPLVIMHLCYLSRAIRIICDIINNDCYGQLCLSHTIQRDITLYFETI